MKTKSLVPAIAAVSLWILWSLVLSPSLPTVSAQGSFLADRHGAKGMNCATCHKESPPAAKAPSAVCIGCHGDNEKVAKKTIKVNPNPHESHLGEVDCQTCHHAHKASELSCAACHKDMSLKVP